MTLNSKDIGPTKGIPFASCLFLVLCAIALTSASIEPHRACDEKAQESKPKETAEETAVSLALADVEAKIVGGKDTLETGLLAIKDCAARIKDLRQQREDLLRRRAALRKKSRRTRQGPTDRSPTRLMAITPERYSYASKKKCRPEESIFARIIKEVKVRGKEVRLSYKLRMTVRTPQSKVLDTLSNGGGSVTV
jgi:hypothetical protein